MSEYMRGHGILWQTSLPLLAFQSQTAETMMLMKDRGLLVDAMKIISMCDVQYYNEVFPKVFEEVGRSRESFLAYFVQLARGEMMTPLTSFRFIKYMAYLYNFAAYCIFENHSSALDYAVIALVATVQVKNELTNMATWIGIFEESELIRSGYLLGWFQPPGVRTNNRRIWL